MLAAPFLQNKTTFPLRRAGIKYMLIGAIDDGNSIAHGGHIINHHGEHTSLHPIRGSEPSKSDRRGCSGAIERARCTLSLNVSKDTYI